MELPSELRSELRQLALVAARFAAELDGQLIPRVGDGISPDDSPDEGTLPPPIGQRRGDVSLRCPTVEWSSGLGSELESELGRLPGILNARVVTDDDGTLRELHVVADQAKSAKQVVRDVATLAVARFGVDIDHRVVSVVQMPPETPDGQVGRISPPAVPQRERSNPANGAAGRVRLESITTGHRGFRFHADVTLALEGKLEAGSAEGSDSAPSRPRVVALATLEAMAQLREAVASADIESAAISSLDGREVATVAVSLSAGDERPLVGAALVGQTGAEVAVARAVLDALNRRVGHFSPARLDQTV